MNCCRDDNRSGGKSAFPCRFYLRADVIFLSFLWGLRAATGDIMRGNPETMELPRFKVQDTFGWLGRRLLVLVYFAVSGILIVFGAIHIIAGFFPELISREFMLPQIIRDALNEAEGRNPGERGDYLNFLIGVPLAAAGSLVAAVVAASAHSIANRQRMVQEMQLIDAKITGQAGNFLELVNAFDDIHEQGALLYDRFKRFLDDCDEHKVHILSVLDDYNEPHELYEVSGPAVDELREKWRERLKANIREIQDRATDVFRLYQVLTFDPFWAQAIDSQGSKVQRDWYMLEEYVRKRLGKRAPTAEWSPRYLSRELRQWTRVCSMTHALYAFLYTPDDACPLEFAGALIRLVTLDERFPSEVVNEEWYNGTHRDVEIINVGAAKLYSLYRALPSPLAISDAVFSLFPRLDSIESRPYFRTLPNKRRITHDEFLFNMDRIFADPRRLRYLMKTTREGLRYRPKRSSELFSDKEENTIRRAAMAVLPGMNGNKR